MIRVLFTGSFRFPDGDAAATRVRSVSRLFQDKGCTVVFAGWEKPKGELEHYTFESCDCYPQSEFRTDLQSLPLRFWGFLRRGERTLDWIESQPRFDIIVAYNPPALFALRLLWRCRQRRVAVSLDSTEWYEADHLPGGRFGPAAIENWVRMRIAYRLFRHVICISRYLEEYFHGRNVVRLPPMTEPSVSTCNGMSGGRPRIQDRLAFVYAGDAGKKDRLTDFIRVLPIIEREAGVSTTLEIAGLSKSELFGSLQRDGLDPSGYERFVRCHGRVSRGEAIELYGKSHFSVIFRENRRYAWAGFPTKAMESWACGCPIICNRVGDLGELGHDMGDCLFVEEHDLAVMLPMALISIMRVPGRYEAMSEMAREMARRYFAPESRRADFAQFFDSLKRELHCDKYDG